MRPVAKRRLWTVPVLVALVLPALCLLPKSGALGLLAALPAVVAAGAALLLRPLWVVGLASAVSLGVDAAYHGDRRWVGLWALLEGPALLVVLFRVVRRAPARAAIWLGASTGVAALVLPLRITLQVSQRPYAGWALVSAPLLVVIGACAGAGWYLRAQDERRRRAVASARYEQRMALAADLHDFVAHEITAIVLEAQVALLAPAPPLSSEAFRAIEEAGQRALSSMDRTVHALRMPSADVLADIQAIALRFGARFEATGTVAGLPDSVGEAVYRVVSEALTNVRRHAPAARNVVISVGEAGGVLTVRVTDDGSHVAGEGSRMGGAGREGGGTGLMGLRARVVLEKGLLTFGPVAGGWEVRADLPIGR